MAKLENLQKLNDLHIEWTDLKASKEKWTTATKFHEDHGNIIAASDEKEYRNDNLEQVRLFLHTKYLNFESLKETALEKINTRIAEIEKEVESL